MNSATNRKSACASGESKSKRSSEKALEVSAAEEEGQNHHDNKRRKKETTTNDDDSVDAVFDCFARVRDYHPTDFSMNRAVITRLVRAGGQKSSVNLNCGGTSKAAVNKAIHTHAAAANGLCRLLAQNSEIKADAIRQTIFTAAVQQTPSLDSERAVSKLQPKLDDLRSDLGLMLRNILRDMKTPSERRPYLAVLSHKYSKTVFEEFMEMRMSHHEWWLIRSHPNAQPGRDAVVAHKLEQHNQRLGLPSK